MRLILSIFALSMFLLSCQGDTRSGTNKCSFVTISDALPVQFWLSECDTYNEFEPQGVHHKCWCQPWNCDDEIVTQFQHTTGQALSLIALNEDGEILYESSIPEVQTGVYLETFTPSSISPEICDELIRLLVNAVATTIFESQFNSGLDGWTNEGTGTAWAWNVIYAEVALTSTAFSKELTKASVQPAGSYRFKSDAQFINFNSSFSDLKFTVSVYNGSTLIKTFIDDTQHINIDNNKQIIYDLVFTVSETFTKVVMTAERTSADSNNISLSVNYAFLYSMNSLAKSDCLDVKTAHDETILVEYSNQRNYAGLVYENDSPDTTFKIRVPCRFVHEREPEEDEAIELTSSIVITSSQVKTQRLLEVKHAPYYFHKKLRRVLKHQSVTIFDKLWKQEDAYEPIEGKKTWLLKSATCWLTQGNSVVRNVL